MSERKLSLVFWISAFLIVATVCFLLIPHKRQESITYEAVEISSDGQILNNYTVHWNATIRKKRLPKDSHYSYIELTVPDLYNFNTSHYTDTEFSFWRHPDSDHEYLGIMFFNQQFSDFSQVSVYRDLEQKWCIFVVMEPTGETKYLIGTTDPNLDPLEIYAQHRSYFQ